MNRVFIGTLCVLVALFCQSAMAQAQIVIAPQHRVPNTPRACCTYATTQTVAAHQGHGAKVVGLTARYDAMAPRPDGHPCHVGLPRLSQELTRLGVPHASTPNGSYDTSLLRLGLATRQPVIVSTQPEPGQAMGHVWGYVGEKGGRVYLYDSNHTERPYVSRPAGQFYRLWDGGAILIRRR